MVLFVRMCCLMFEYLLSQTYILDTHANLSFTSFFTYSTTYVQLHVDTS